MKHCISDVEERELLDVLIDYKSLILVPPHVVFLFLQYLSSSPFFLYSTGIFVHFLAGITYLCMPALAREVFFLFLEIFDAD